MKTLLLIAAPIVVIVWFGISTSRKEQTALETSGMPNRYVRVIEIDGCQYLQFSLTGGMDAYEHKGNCNNPIHTKP